MAKTTVEGIIYLSFASVRGWVITWQENGREKRVSDFETEAAARKYARKHGIKIKGA